MTDDLPSIADARTQAAERAWDSQMYSTKVSIERALNGRFREAGAAGLKRRRRYLNTKPRLISTELAELHALGLALDTLAANQRATQRSVLPGKPATPKENRSPMSQARRTAEALEAARENTRIAASAVGQHRSRGERSTLPQHITDMAELVEAMVTIHGITTDLAAIAKTCADDVRARYFSGYNPTSGSWPEPLKEAASDGYRALTRLRQHLTRTAVPAHGGHDALSILHGFLRDVHRATAHQ